MLYEVRLQVNVIVESVEGKGLARKLAKDYIENKFGEDYRPNSNLKPVVKVLTTKEIKI